MAGNGWHQIHKLLFTRPLSTFGLLVLAAACSPRFRPHYQPDDPALHRKIVQLDSTFFDAYNHCETKLAEYAAFYADDVEFYHDRGGLSSSKADFVAATQQYICGKVTRLVLPSTIEVYPIKDYGAIEFGYHSFHNSVENSTSKPSRFVIVWRQTSDAWHITRVISLH
jgi:ketosteroid isomerase-like protein